MLTNDEQLRLTGNDRPFHPPSGLLGKILATAASAAVLVITFMLSLVIFAAIVGITLLVVGYVWWKTRAARRQMREAGESTTIIEGEARREASPDPEQNPTAPR